ncbi:MAG: DUF2252 domain-containing protein [Pseudanabaenaceae cyanobacterium]
MRLLSLGILLTVPWAAWGAAPRSVWVEQEIYNFNRPLAQQLPQEIATKMQKMAASPFAFYRGTAHLFYQDMKTLPASRYQTPATGYVWLEGDMHLQNLGAFQDSKGNFVFDTTDFDEGYWGQYHWDVRRMAVSIILAAKENGLGSSDRQALVTTFLDSYLDTLENFRGNDTETSFKLTTANTNGYVKDLIQAAQGRTRAGLLDKFTTIVVGKRQFKTTSDLVPVSSAQYSAIQGGMSSYVNSISASKRQPSSFYTLKDVRLKLGSGNGSLGRYRYYLLIEGATSSPNDDVILEMKQQLHSAVSIAAPGRMPSSYYNNHQGERVSKTIKALLNHTDPLVGHTTVNGQFFFVREKSPWAEDFDYTQLKSFNRFNNAVAYAGAIVAKNHALADKDYDPSLNYSQDKQILEAITSKAGFKQEITKFALDYAQQVELDYNAFLSAYRSGKFSSWR